MIRNMEKKMAMAAKRAKPGGSWGPRHKAVISISIDMELLARIDKMCDRKHLTRASWISLISSERLERDEVAVP